MIISASRRTDIPSYYSDWFFNRIKEGYVLVRNPMSYHRIRRISLVPDAVDGIVFWTKNPAPMLARLDEIKDFMYYFLFTITPYGNDIEPNLPSKGDAIMPVFKRLSDIIGVDRVIWRYDPILINEKYTSEYHLRAFGNMAEALHKYTRKVIISFIDVGYRGVKSNIKDLALLDFPPADQMALGSRLAKIAHGYGLAIESCACKLDLRGCGIEPARCIDDRLLGKLLGGTLVAKKDKNQRLECGCVSSVDIGMYNSCRNGCRYCYANFKKYAIEENFVNHSPASPLISGEVSEDDSVKD